MIVLAIFRHFPQEQREALAKPEQEQRTVAEQMDALREHWEAAWDAELALLGSLGASDIAGLLAAYDQIVAERPPEAMAQIYPQLSAAFGIGHDARGVPLESLVVLRGHFVIVPRALRERFRHVVTDLVLEHLPSEGAAIAELGCGWGQNLFRIHVARPHSGRIFHACEWTEAGRKAVATLAALAPGMDCRPRAFDHRNADFSFLRGLDEVLVFTAHSLEQIEDVGIEYFERLLEATRGCSGLHVEPVGWQRFPDLLERYREGVPKEEQKVTFSLDSRMVAPMAARWARTKGYNRDLLSVLETLEGRGRIRITRRRYDYFGEAAFNPSTVIAWTKA